MTSAQTVQASVLSPACPLCHTPFQTVTTASIQAGAYWACTRCGHKWTAERLATAEAYAQSQLRPRVQANSTNGTQKASR